MLLCSKWRTSIPTTASLSQQTAAFQIHKELTVLAQQSAAWLRQQSGALQHAALITCDGRPSGAGVVIKEQHPEPKHPLVCHA